MHKDCRNVISPEIVQKIKLVLRSHPKGVSIKEISRRMHMNRNSVASYLNLLLISGHIEMKTFGASKIFFLTDRVPISSLLSFSQDYILVLDRDTKIVQVNHHFQKFLGREKEELIGSYLDGLNLPVLNDPEVRLRIPNAFGKEKIVVEVRHILEEKELFFRVSLIPTVFEEGGQGITVLMEDITEYKRAEKIRRLLASVVENSNDAIIGRDLDGRVLSWNAAAERMFGYAPVEIIGKPASIIIPPDLQDEFVKIHQKIFSGESIRQLETRRRKKDGTILDVCVTISPIRDDDGTIVGTSSIARDISELKEVGSELRNLNCKLKNIIEFLPDPTFIIDTEKKVIEWNNAIENLTDVKREAILGRGDYAYAIPFYGKPRPVLIDLLEGSQEGLEKEYQNVRHVNGSIYAEAFTPALYGGEGAFLWGKASPLLDESGERIGAIESIRDITAWKRDTEAFHRKYAEIEQRLKEKEEEIAQESQRDPSALFSSLEKALEKTIDPILILDTAGRIRQVNNALVHLLKLQNNAPLIGKSIGGLITLEHVKNVLGSLSEVRKNGNTIIQFPFLTDEGRANVEGSISLITDDAGTPQGYIMICRDLSYRTAK